MTMKKELLDYLYNIKAETHYVYLSKEITEEKYLKILKVTDKLLDLIK